MVYYIGTTSAFMDLLLYVLPPTASVHLPRIGYNTPGFNWYGTERLIRKHLATKGIPTYVYPFSHSGAGIF